ncbi:hypothetical protein HDU78_004675, partial [Chytriomyces hyalinus]
MQQELKRMSGCAGIPLATLQQPQGINISANAKQSCQSLGQCNATPATAAESNEESIDIDDNDNEYCKDNNLDDKMGYKYQLRHLEDDLDCCSSTMRAKAVRWAINEWYEIVGMPKVCYLDPSKELLGILEVRVPGHLAKSLARHVGTRVLEWR